MRPFLPVLAALSCCASLGGVGSLGCSSSGPTSAGAEDSASLDGGALVDSALGSDAPSSDAPKPGDASADASREGGVDAPADGPVDAPEAPSDGPTSGHAILRVHYPVAAGHRLTVRGAASPLTWTTGVDMGAGADDTWSYDAGSLGAPTEWKPMLDDATWSRGPNYVVRPGETLDVWPHFVHAGGSFSRAYTFHSPTLGNDRGVWIYLPPTELENHRARFPVVYMHDGQNLFDPSTSFGGVAWRVDQALDAGAEDGTIREAIVVGVENTSARMWEYTPTRDATVGDGGGASQYLTMLVAELAPKIDAELPTLATREDRALIGSSLGGLVSAYAGDTHAETFGLIGAMSPSTWWDSTFILGDVAATKGKSPAPLRVYVDSGDSGPSSDDVANTAKLAQAYRDLGYVDGSTLDYLVQAGGQHNETYWSQRLPGALAFLLGPRRPAPP